LRLAGEIGEKGSNPMATCCQSGLHLRNIRGADQHGMPGIAQGMLPDIAA
jgi:hypothetical protein